MKMEYYSLSLTFLLLMIFFWIIAIMYLKKCSFMEAVTFIASSFLKNEYELSSDFNYYNDCCKILKDILGDKRFDDLCELDQYSPIIFFNDTHAGNPSVCITVNPSYDSERIRLSNILEDKTRIQLTNYYETNQETFVSWSENKKLSLPMLVIEYARNKKEADAIRQKKLYAAKTILTASTDIIDEEEDLL